MLLQMIEKRHDQRRIDLLERQARRRRVQPLLRKLQQQTEGIAIRTDRVRTRLPLLHQALGEEPFQQGSQAEGGGHDRSSQRCSSRRIASRISSGEPQIPLRIGDVDMAEVGGQDGQAALGILTGPVPAHEGLRRESVAQIMETWAVTVRGPRRPICRDNA